VGHRLGPESYFGWNDGDPELVRAIWCLIRHLNPAVVVETGVARGFTTRLILEALERNGWGGSGALTCRRVSGPCGASPRCR